MSFVTIEEVRAAKGRAEAVFRPFGEVTGVGITRVAGHYALKINLEAEPAAGLHLPTEVDGVPVRVEIVGVLRKHDDPETTGLTRDAESARQVG